MYSDTCMDGEVKQSVFGHPVEYVRQLLPCPTVISAIEAYKAGFMPLVHPSIFDEVHQAIDEIETVARLTEHTPLAFAMRLLEDEWDTGRVGAVILVDGTTIILRQNRDKRHNFETMTVHAP